MSDSSTSTTLLKPIEAAPEKPMQPHPTDESESTHGPSSLVTNRPLTLGILTLVTIAMAAVGIFVFTSGDTETALIKTEDSDIGATTLKFRPSSQLQQSDGGGTASTLSNVGPVPPSEPQAIIAPPPGVPDNGRPIVWIDTFDTFNSDQWRKEHFSNYGDGNGEVQCYMDRNTSVRDGMLVLVAKKEKQPCEDHTRSYTSGMVRGRGLLLKPGQGIEFRVKLTPGDDNNQRGLWPAVWASSWAPGGWPKGGEADYLEVMTAEDPKRAMFAMHYMGPNKKHKLKNKGVYLDRNFSDKWHTIRFDYGWGGKMKWYLNGEQGFEVNWADTIQGWPEPFNQTMKEIKINLALGGRPGPLDDRALSDGGATFAVDYIRVFKL